MNQTYAANHSALPTDAPVTANLVQPRRRNWLLLGLMVVVLGPFVLMVGIVMLLTLVTMIGANADVESEAAQTVSHESPDVSFQGVTPVSLS